jgi:uncharacterized damage-inducible protein DinB
LTLPDGTLFRLKTQLDVLPSLLGGSGREAVEARSPDGKWSARENLAHLARYQSVFLERIERILEEEIPDLGRYRAEGDPAWPEWSALPLEQILERLKTLRARIVQVASGLTDEQAARRGLHPVLGPMPLARWIEFFLLHEAHHLYIVMNRLGPSWGQVT